MGRFKQPAHVESAVVRSNALLTIIVASIGSATATWWVMAALALDFAVRGFLNPRWSVISLVSGRVVTRVLPFTRKQIFFPPKQFAARVGLLVSAASAFLFAAGLPAAGLIVAAMLVVFAALECFLNICMGCIIYNAFIAPMRRRRVFGDDS